MRDARPTAAVLFAAGLALAVPTESSSQARPGRGQGDAVGPLAIPDVPRDRVVCFALYTVHDGTLKMTAQLYPLAIREERTVRLEVERDGEWVEVAAAEVDPDGWAAVLRVDGWDRTRATPYRVRHGERAEFRGTIRRDPVDSDEIVLAAFTGNSIHPNHGGDISRDDLIANVRAIDADLLFFSGDQVYDHDRHLAAWLKFGRDFGEIIKDRPTITIPDDHDVGQANLWGAAGKQSRFGAGHDGGYFKPVEYVRMVERAQTSHLPDPVDPAPVQRGIGVYFTELRWGRVSFAILEDRKFKSGPSGLVEQRGPRPDHVADVDYDPAQLDVPGAVLLGERQLRFLDRWGADWAGADFKVALSQTIFCGGAHLHGKVGGRVLADLDSNGWPQSGRNRALAALRRAFAVHVAGDQHLATVFRHGIDDWNDAGYSFCVPSIANLYLRWWDPLEPGRNRTAGQPPHLGEHRDGFGNRITCVAVANPSRDPNRGEALTTRAAGFGVVRFDKRARRITFECWPRNVEIGTGVAAQYPGWPITIDQVDNYGRAAAAYLPKIVVRGRADPVVQVVDEHGAVVYTLRIRGHEFVPKVFAHGRYTVHVGEGARRVTRTDVRSVEFGSDAVLEVELDG